MQKTWLYFLVGMLLIAYPDARLNAQSLYEKQTIQRIELFFSAPDWDYRMDTAMYGEESYLMADSVRINGRVFDSVGVRYKGNSSYDSTYAKNPLHIELNTYKDHHYQGYTDIKLGNGYADPAVVREVMAYEILSAYMDCPKANFAQVYINGKYTGVYTNAESINNPFCENLFNASNNTFIKCNPVINPGPASKSNLKYISGDTSAYANLYEIKSDAGWNDLVNLCDTVTNHAAAVDQVIDIDRALWMLAFNNVLVNLDSYSGGFCQNYYLYKDNTGLFNPIVWDLNMSFGGFPFAGSPNNGLGSLNVTGMQQLNLLLHNGQADWPLITALYANPSWKKMYVAHARSIVEQQFANLNYQALAGNWSNRIDTAVKSDSNGFYTYSDFQQGMTGNVANGSYTIPGITNLMSARVTYLQATNEFKAAAPVITQVSASASAPKLNDEITIQATATNAGSVFLGTRFQRYHHFVRTPMYDDGLHNDGAANDQVYGCQVKMASEVMHYYIYAENDSAGKFLPENAEHVYLTLEVPRHQPVVGDIVINEFVASNKKSDINEYGIYTDWIELYNNTSDTLSLFGMYLSDDSKWKGKFAIPAGAYILPHSYFAVWADGLPSKRYVHASFRLSGEGGYVSLSNEAGTRFDSITYSAQLEDVSMGRCPDGAGAFYAIATPSFLGSNNGFCTAGLSDAGVQRKVLVYPVPASDKLYLYTGETGRVHVSIFDLTGSRVLTTTIDNNAQPISVSALPDGFYFCLIEQNGIAYQTKWVKKN